MQDKNKMHPDDLRNLIVFGAISLLMWLAYSHFILEPQKKQMLEARQVAKQTAIMAQTEAGFADQERDRAEIITEQKAQATRIDIETSEVFGTINLVGARLDDLSLKEYFQTVERIDNSVVLYPRNTAHPHYIENGWASPDKNLKLPNTKTRWQVVGNEKLTPSTPVTLQWNNGQRVTFEQKISIDEHFMFNIQKRIINNTNAAIVVYPYSIIAQRDIPADFMNRFVVHEGPIGYIGDELYEETYGKMSKDPLIVKTADRGWIGLTTKDWHTAIIPEQGLESKYRFAYTKGATEQIKDLYQTDVTGPAISVQAGEAAQSEVNIFAGAKKLSLLNEYEDKLNIPHFDLAVDFGIFYFLTKPFFYVINFLYGIVGNFGVAIILFTILLRICVFPLANTSFKSFARMKKMGPQMTELRTKYADDKQKMQQELVKLYQKEKVNPMAGCLPILVQIPIFFSLFKVLSNTIEMRHAPFVGWIQDLSMPDPTSMWNLFGLLPWDGPDFLSIGIWPIFMLITMLLQRKLSPPPADKMQAQLFALIPWIMTVILANFAAGLVIYWTFNNLFATIQQYIIMKRMGVEVDLIGNILGRNKDKEMEPVDGIHPEAQVASEKIEEALSGDDEPPTPPKKVTKPKPKKSKKKK